MYRCRSTFLHLFFYSTCGRTQFKTRKDLTTRLTMDSSTFINALLLCLLNASFMVAGTFLNSVVIISLWRSSQLRKKLCYFMILVLSCFDLAVVTITHPVLIFSTIFWSMKTDHEGMKIVKFTWTYTSVILAGFSMLALLTLTIERLLALKYPFFHQTAVTKKRLTLFLAVLISIAVALSSLSYFAETIFVNISIFTSFLIMLFVFIYLNYEMFIIAKSKRKEERVVGIATSGDEERRKRKLNFNNISTCSLAVACYFVCSFPQIIYSALRLTSETPFYDKQVLLFNIWTCTFLSINSTFNCLIFFWRNSILRREGLKVAKCLRTANS